MAINIATLKPASIKAKEIATEEYVDTKVSNIDFSGSINNNNDIFAQKLGYLNYQAMVNAATSGQTIINGGYINTQLVRANAITANMINTSGLIADNISTTVLNGTTINGGVINGARINGAVIKASYLDLNGQLEVLTNYIITTAMYNASPWLYTDAVYISSDNQYRIPSISTVREHSSVVDISSVNSIFNSNIRSYNCGNAGHNNKCVKSSGIYINGGTKILSISNPTQKPHDCFMFSSNKVQIYIAGNYSGLEVQYISNHAPASYDAEMHGTPEYTEYYWLLNGNRVNSIAVNGFNFTVSANILYYQGSSVQVSFVDTSSSLFKLVNVGGWNVKVWRQEYTTYYASKVSSAKSVNTAYMTDSITINNMI